ncbi:MAG: 7-cyano-7-deazaguanine synthase QueC [Armatimonadetes bacterium]|nr:MAG: 7-cyano-7-deazaguanine synthase QueC [Armatimonadota bacterium]
MPARAVVLLSGGLDSTTCLALAKGQGYEVYALSVDYGQRHRFELEAAKQLARWADVREHVILPLDLSIWGGSALTSGDIPVPKDGPSSGIPPTYVPARNTILLACALGLAEVKNADAIFIGVNALDYSGYPDCRPAFLEAFEQLVQVATKATADEGRRIQIVAPLLHKTKAEIVRLAHDLGVPIELTVSCYDPDPQGRPCGLCDACRLRAKGFQEAGLTDPAVSATP